MDTRRNISTFLLLTISVVSIGLFSFYSPQKEVEIIEDNYRIEELEDRPVSTTDQIVSFELYEDSENAILHLILSGTYGSIVLSPEMTDTTPVFVIPASFTKKAGTVAYHLVRNKQTIQKGTFKLLPNLEKLGAIETYLGPRSIVANVRDYSMLVSIPTDTLDNLLPDKTEVQLKSQFKTAITTTTHNLSSGVAWKRIFAPLKTGRLSTGSTLENRSSKELIADIFPDTAQDFTIMIENNHSYADGNEIITFKTTQIKDAHDNIMTDGTLVTFYIRDNSGAYWQTNASTVNGYAFAKALHPQSPSTWQINAAINGIAQSPEIKQTFKAIIETIPVRISKNREIVVGPLTSYLGQLVQNGIGVSLEINKMIYKGLTKNGNAQFYLKEEDYPKGEYTFKIKTLGLETIKKITLD